jgi:hypothetical protein
MFQLLRSTGLWTLALHAGIKQHSPAAVAVSRQEIDAQYSWCPAGSFRDFTGCGGLVSICIRDSFIMSHDSDAVYPSPAAPSVR